MSESDPSLFSLFSINTVYLPQLHYHKCSISTPEESKTNQSKGLSLTLSPNRVFLFIFFINFLKFFSSSDQRAKCGAFWFMFRRSNFGGKGRQNIIIRKERLECEVFSLHCCTAALLLYCWGSDPGKSREAAVWLSGLIPC